MRVIYRGCLRQRPDSREFPPRRCLSKVYLVDFVDDWPYRSADAFHAGGVRGGIHRVSAVRWAARLC